MANVDFLRALALNQTRFTAPAVSEQLCVKRFRVTPTTSTPIGDTWIFGHLPLGCIVVSAMAKAVVAGDQANANASLGAYPDVWVDPFQNGGISVISDSNTGYAANGILTVFDWDSAAGQVKVAMGAQVSIPLDTTLWTSASGLSAANMTAVALGLTFDTAASGTVGTWDIIITYMMP